MPRFHGKRVYCRADRKDPSVGILRCQIQFNGRGERDKIAVYYRCDASTMRLAEPKDTSFLLS